MQSVVVVGAGVFGLSAALEAARRGRSVVVIEQDTVPNPRAASWGASRSVRSTYADPAYAALARAALDGWRRLETEAGVPLLERSGNMYYTNLDAQPELEARLTGAQAGGSAIEEYEGAALRTRYPYLRRARRAILEPEAAFVRATDALAALHRLAADSGVVTLAESEATAIEPAAAGVAVTLASGTVVEADQVVVAGGGWTASVLPEVASRLQQRRQGVVHVLDAPPWFDHPATDQFMCLDSMLFGFPGEPGVGLKIGRHSPGPATSPDFDRDAAPDDFVTVAQEFLRDDLGLDPDAHRLAWSSCMYNLTPRSDFVLDDVAGRPGVIVATGGSGHGFKFGPMIGEIVADLLDGIRRPDRWLERFSWTAFQTADPSGRPL